MLGENERGTGQRDPGTRLPVRVLGFDHKTTGWYAVDVGGETLAEVEELCRPRLGRRTLGFANGPTDVSGLSPLDEKVWLENHEIVCLDLDGDLEDFGTAHYVRSGNHQCEDKGVRAGKVRPTGNHCCPINFHANAS